MVHLKMCVNVLQINTSDNLLLSVTGKAMEVDGSR